MKPIPILVTILVLGMTAGIWQRSKLRNLQHRSATAMSKMPAVKLTRTPAPVAAEVAKVGSADMESMVEDFAAAFLAFNDRSESDRAEKSARSRKIMLASATFDSRDIEELFQKLRSDPRFAEAEDDAAMNLCLDIFPETVPAAAMVFLESHRDLRDWNGHYAGCFHNYLASNPREAIRWFDDQAALGNSDVTDSSMRSAILLGEARVDPDRMLARAISPDFASDPEVASLLGAFVASTLDSAAEYRQFFAALRRTQEKAGESPRLAKIRADFVGALSSPLAALPFEEASAIMESEFTAAERLRFAGSECHRADLDGLEKWADWYLNIGYDDWKKREVTPGSPSDHPAAAVFETWAESDWQAAGKWLEKLPSGPLRSEMISTYVKRIAPIDSAAADAFRAKLSE